jgi:Family of unknown function (DUF5309)
MAVGNAQISTVVPYLGELFQTVKRPNSLLKLAGHFQGESIGEPFAYKESTAREFPIGAFYTLVAPSQPAVLEGANAPAAEYTALTQTTNVVQIFHKTVQVTYLAESDKSVSGIVPIPMGAAQGEVQNPRSTAFQVMATLERIAQDLNYSMFNGVYANPANPAATALQMRGLIPAIITCINDQSAVAGNTVTAAMYRGFINGLLATMMAQNGYALDGTFTLFAGTTEFSNVCAAYEAFGTIYLTPESIVGGVKLRHVLTRFGTLNLVLDPDVPAQQLVITPLSQVGIVGLPVPDKGVLFEEPLFKQGSADQTQIYGQLGIDHGPEWLSGLLRVSSGISL